MDAVAEFKVVTNNNSAEYGYRMGAKVVVSTKSGTNELHGTLYEFLRNEKFDGTNFFANRSGSKKPTLRQNQFGGTSAAPSSATAPSSSATRAPVSGAARASPPPSPASMPATATSPGKV